MNVFKARDVLKASLIDVNTGEVIQNFENYSPIDNGVYAFGGNQEKAKFPIIFDLRGDFAIMKEYELGKTIRLKVDGFDEEVKLLDVNNEGITFETTPEVGDKLRKLYFN